MNLKLTVREHMVPSEILQTYLNETDKTKALTREEEAELFAQIKLGKSALEAIKLAEEGSDEYVLLDKRIKDAIVARDKVVLSCQKLIYAIAKRYRQDDIVLDLISEGNLGVIEAIDSYDIETGNKFATYASWYINRNIQTFVNNTSLLIQRPSNIIYKTRIVKFRDKFYAENGRFPSEEEILDAMNDMGVYIPRKEDLHDISFFTIEYTPDRNADDDDDENANSLSYGYIVDQSVEDISIFNEYEGSVDVEDERNRIDEALSVLSEKEKTIIMLAYGIGETCGERTNKEVATIIGMSAERVRQIKARAMEKVKASVAA